MATSGWVSLTSVERPEVVVTTFTVDEVQAAGGGEPPYIGVEARVNAILGRHDLRVPWLVSVERDERPAAGVSFQDFLKTYRSPRLLYRDIFTPGSFAEKASTESREQFERGGGMVTRL